jgi:hypothetical protein
MTALLSCGNSANQQPNAASAGQAQGLRREMPEAEWEPSFYKALAERTKKVNLPSLRGMVLSDQDLEVRFWYDASPRIINGFVIRRWADQWSALGIRQSDEGQHYSVKQEVLRTPKSGWETAWQRLLTAGILTLPDGSKCSTEALDGAGFVVETNVKGVYRTYRYSNPQFAKCEEARQVLLIEQIIAEEFDP